MAEEEQEQPLSDPELLVEDEVPPDVTPNEEEEVNAESKPDDLPTNEPAEESGNHEENDGKRETKPATLSIGKDDTDSILDPKTDEAAVEDPKCPDYLASEDDVLIQTVCIQSYERRTTSTFPKEEYYAFKVVTVLHSTSDTGETKFSPESTEGKTKVKWEVWRRYTEFELLKSFFAIVYPHAIVPPIPEKKLQGSSGILSKIAYGEDVDFLIRRQRALEIFLVRVNRHEVLKKNRWFIRFLSDQNNWKSDMVATGYQAMAESRFKALTQVLSSHKPDIQFLDILNYSVDLRSALESLVLNRERMNVFLVGMYRGYSTFGKIFHEMALSEQTLGDQLQKTAGFMESYAGSVDTYVEEEELRYLLPMKEYIAFCDSLKAVVGRQEQVQLEYDNAEDEVIAKVDAREKLEKEKSDQEAGRPQGGFTFKKFFKFGAEQPIDERLAALDSEMSALDEVCKEKRRKLKAFNNAALEEFETFNTQKVADFRSVLINLAYLQIQLHKKGLSAWERVKASYTPKDNPQA